MKKENEKEEYEVHVDGVKETPTKTHCYACSNFCGSELCPYYEENK